MINKIFLDLDETLIHTEFPQYASDKHLTFKLNGSSIQYYTTIRECALELIEFSRNLVGKDNVYILTIATEDYANAINDIAGFGFDKDHIFSRETIQNNWAATTYGARVTLPCKEASRENCLIDNRPWNENTSKMSFIGITRDRYFQCEDYYGYEYSDATFVEDAKEYLIAINKEPKL